jgi:hypothetical protein
MLNFATWEPEKKILANWCKLYPPENQKTNILSQILANFAKFDHIPPKKEFARFRQVHSIKSGIGFLPEFLVF